MACCNKYKRTLNGSTTLGSNSATTIVKPKVNASTYAIHTKTTEINKGNLSETPGARNFTCDPITESGNGTRTTLDNSASVRTDGTYVGGLSANGTIMVGNNNTNTVMKTKLPNPVTITCPHCNATITTEVADTVVQCPVCQSDIYLKSKMLLQAFAITTHSDNNMDTSSSSSSDSDSDTGDNVTPVVVQTSRPKRRRLVKRKKVASTPIVVMDTNNDMKRKRKRKNNKVQIIKATSLQTKSCSNNDDDDHDDVDYKIVKTSNNNNHAEDVSYKILKNNNSDDRNFKILKTSSNNSNNMDDNCKYLYIKN